MSNRAKNEIFLKPAMLWTIVQLTLELEKPRILIILFKKIKCNIQLADHKCIRL